MISLSSKCFIVSVIAGLLIFGYGEVMAADWILSSSGISEDVYYDAESITHPSKDIVRFWSKMVFNVIGRIRKVEEFGEKYWKLDYALTLIEINCKEKNTQYLSIVEFSKDGNILFSVSFTTPTWEYIPPESVGEKLFKILCKSTK